MYNHVDKSQFFDELGLPTFEKKYNFKVYKAKMLEHAESGGLVTALILAGLLHLTPQHLNKLRREKEEFAVIFSVAHAISACVNAERYTEAGYDGSHINTVIAKDVFERSQIPLKQKISIKKAADDLVQELVDAVSDGWLTIAEMHEIRESVLSLQSFETMQEMKEELEQIQAARKEDE